MTKTIGGQRLIGGLSNICWIERKARTLWDPKSRMRPDELWALDVGNDANDASRRVSDCFNSIEITVLKCVCSSALLRQSVVLG